MVLDFAKNAKKCILVSISAVYLLSAPLVLVSVLWNFFNEKFYRYLKSEYFSIETHFVVTEYAYIIIRDLYNFSLKMFSKTKQNRNGNQNKWRRQ